MKVFISYSAKDTSLIRKFADGLKHQVAGVSQVHWWEDSKRLGKEAWPQIFRWIDEADFVLVIVTGNVLSRAMAVGNEVGYAKAKGKSIIPLISEPSAWSLMLQRFGVHNAGINAEDLGCLGELVHDRINKHDPKAGIEKIKNELMQMAKERQAANEAEKAKMILGLLTVVGVLWASS